MKKILFIFIAVLISVSTSAETYYVKNGGSDAAAGTTDATAWETVNKANTTISGGDTVLFERGSYWREQITPIDGSIGDKTYYGAYGTGVKPLFLGSETKNETTDWTETAPGNHIWTTAASSFTIDVGNIVFNNVESFGVKVMSAIPTLDAQGKFWYDFTNDLVQLYSVGNPATVYSNIECCKNWSAVHRETFSYTTFQNLEWKFWAEDGVYMTHGSSNNDFLDLDMSYLGGGDMLGDYTVRFGGGIVCYRGTSDITILRCRIDNCYDEGISPQGNASEYTISNWVIRNNIITNCQLSFNYFTGVGSTVDGIYFENNTCLYAGYEWSNNQRPNGTYSRHIRIGVNNGTSSNIFIRNNIFYESVDRIYSINDDDDATDFVIDYNCVYTSGTRIGYIGGIYYLSWDDWLNNGKCTPDVNSVNADPLFSGTTFELTSTSKAINRGIDVGLTSDYAGTSVPQGLYFDIGAYEFTGFPLSTTGMGWEDILSHRNFKGSVNFADGFSVEGVPIVFSGGSPVNLPGLTASVPELNKLDGAIVTTAEINYLKGLTDTIPNLLEAKADTVNQAFTGTITLPVTTSIGDVSYIEIGYINGVTSAIQTQLGAKADTADNIDISTVAVMLVDTLRSSGKHILYTQWQVDSLAATIGGGVSIGDVRDEIADSLNALRPIAAATVTGFTPASGSLTLSGADALTLTTTNSTDVTLPTTGTLATTTQVGAKADTAASKLLADRVLVFAPVIGVGNAGDTAAFTLNNVIWGAKWEGSNSLVITKVTGVVYGTTPDIDVDLLYDANFRDSTPTEVFSSDLTITSTTTGSNASINTSNDTIASGSWLWLRIDQATAKPTQCIINIYGYLE